MVAVPMRVEDSVLILMFARCRACDAVVAGLIACNVCVGVGKSGALICFAMVLMLILGEFLKRGRVLLLLCSFKRSEAVSLIICCLITCTNAFLEV